MNISLSLWTYTFVIRHVSGVMYGAKLLISLSRLDVCPFNYAAFVVSGKVEYPSADPEGGPGVRTPPP